MSYELFYIPVIHILYNSFLNKNITPNDQNSIKNEHWKWQVRKYDNNIIDTIKSIKILPKKI